MNYLAIIAKHLSAIEKAHKGIKSEESLRNARDRISASCARMGLGFFPLVVPGGETETRSSGTTVQASVDMGRGELPVSAESLLKAVETPVVALPVVPEEPAVEGDVGGTGTFYAQTFVTVNPSLLGDYYKDAGLVEMVGGWPVVGEIEIIGLAPNRRSLKGKLADGRVVSLERTLKAWKAADRVKGKLVQGGSYPLFRAIA